MTTTNRLPLFVEADFSSLDFGSYDLQKIVWSHSRRQLLEQCAKKYYCEHFGSSTRKNQHPRVHQLRFLKNLENRYERAGAILHQVIATWFRKAQSGDPWDAERLVRWAGAIFRQDVAFSKANPDGSKGSENKTDQRYPPSLLREFHYRERDAEQNCGEIERRLLSAVRTFVDSAAFADFRHFGSAPDALIEVRTRLTGFPCRVEGKVDLAFLRDTTVTIVDWKLGTSDGSGDDSLQLGTYGLWALERWPSARDVIVYKAFLGDEQRTRWDLTEWRKQATRARIIQDAQRMATLEDYGREGVFEAFTACGQPAVCAQCNYMRMCLEGRACLGYRN